MSANSISEAVSTQSLPIESADWTSQDIDEATRQSRSKKLLATLDAVNSEVEERVRRGQTTWEEIEEFIGSLDRKAP